MRWQIRCFWLKHLSSLAMFVYNNSRKLKAELNGQKEETDKELKIHKCLGSFFLLTVIKLLQTNRKAKKSKPNLSPTIYISPFLSPLLFSPEKLNPQSKEVLEYPFELICWHITRLVFPIWLWIDRGRLCQFLLIKP